jgi:hypothetical protein
VGMGFQPERQVGEGVPTREAPVMPGTDYRGYEHPMLKQMVETNMDPGQVNDIGMAWESLGEALVAFRDAIVEAAGQSEGDWGGAAGDAARRYFAGVGEWMGQTGEAFHLTAYRLKAQSESAASARAQMPEPVNFSMDDALAMLRDETKLYYLADTVREINQRFAEKQQAHERAAEVMAAYAKSIAETGAGMPDFVPVPAMGQVPAEGRTATEDAAKPKNDPGTVSWPGRSAPVAVQTSEQPGPSNEDARIAPEPGSTPIQSAEVPRPITERQQAFAPVADQQPQAFAPSADQRRMAPDASPPGVPPTGVPVPGTGPGKPSGGHSPGPGRLGIVGEPGIRGGLAGHPTAQGSHAAATPNGFGTAPLAGARLEEERERLRPGWLVEADTAGVFGADVETAPPVLGED